MDCEPLDAQVVPEMTRVFSALHKIDDPEAELKNNWERIRPTL
jgi:hypothetical protein